MNQRLNFLLNLYLNQISTEGEESELFDLLAVAETEEVEMMMMEFMEQQEPTVDEERRSKLLMKILSDDAFQKEQNQAPVKKIFLWKRVAAAAAIIVAIAGGSYYLLTRDNKHEIATNEPQETRFKNDVVAPTKARATITLADGRTVALDSVSSGRLATQGNVSVTKTAEGKIVYNGSSKEEVYNTLTNPRGSLVIDMTLADGSRVWLNAGSSVTYPVAFAGKERKISITGEAYFEVTHNASKPFVVEKNDMKVQVLGTHFNVNAYDDEEKIKVTLLEGSIRVNNGTKSGVLRPGQQAQISIRQIKDDINILNDVDVDQVMAWRNGMFEFHDTEFPVIMRQVSRWYDVEVVYQGKPINAQFGGGLSMKLPLTSLLKLLEGGGMKFKVEGKKVTVIY